jgi:hypothetical protein
MSTAYHPEMDGQTKRVNQIIEQYLQIFCNERFSDWCRFLSTGEFAYNNAPSETTKLSPFFIETGYNPRMAPDAVGELSHPSLEDMFENRIEAQEQAKVAIKLAGERAKWYFDLKHSKVNFKVGDLIMLKGKEVHIKEANHKLAAKNYGPYEILEQLGPVTFKVKLPLSTSGFPLFKIYSISSRHNRK